MGVADHFHCIVCGRILLNWPNCSWYLVKMEGRTVCYCDGECKEIFERER